MLEPRRTRVANGPKILSGYRHATKRTDETDPPFRKKPARPLWYPPPSREWTHLFLFLRHLDRYDEVGKTRTRSGLNDPDTDST